MFDSKFKTFDDWDMWLKISEMEYEFDFIPEYLINYIVHGNNACYNNNTRNKQEFVNLYEKHENTFNNYNLKEVGLYYFYKRNYRLSRKIYLKHILLKNTELDQKIISFAYIILSFCPNLENYFKNIFSKLKKI